MLALAIPQSSSAIKQRGSLESHLFGKITSLAIVTLPQAILVICLLDLSLSMFPKTDTLFRLCSPSYSHSFKHLCTSLEVLANLHRILEHREDLYSTLYYCTAGCTTPQDILPTQNLCFRCATSPIPSYITRAKVHSKTSYYMTLHTGVHTSRAVVTLDSTIDTHKDSLQYFEHSLAIRDVQEQWSRISY